MGAFLFDQNELEKTVEKMCVNYLHITVILMGAALRIWANFHILCENIFNVNDALRDFVLKKPC